MGSTVRSKGIAAEAISVLAWEKHRDLSCWVRLWVRLPLCGALCRSLACRAEGLVAGKALHPGWRLEERRVQALGSGGRYRVVVHNVLVKMRSAKNLRTWSSTRHGLKTG
jgi:hypothetical protein